MRFWLFFGLSWASIFSAEAQFGNLLNKAKAKVQQRVDAKVDAAMNKALDEAEGKATTAKPAASNPANAQSAETPTASGFQSFSKFDFIPGDQVIYAQDFANDAVGELPAGWNASGKGEVQTIATAKGKWLRLFEATTYLSANKKSFGANYTVEFDAIYFFQPAKPGYVMPNWRLGLLSSGGADGAGNTFLSNPDQVASGRVEFAFNGNGGARFTGSAEGKQVFRSDRVELGDLMPLCNQVVHYSLQVQKSRLRLWMGGRKILDLPRALDTAEGMNQLFFFLEGSNYEETEVGLYLGNLKVASGLPDLRGKLVQQGSFSTTGLLFASGTAQLQPESAGVLREIAQLLQADESLRLQIVGHTDADGAEAANLTLSRQRAEAVKAALAKDFGVASDRLSTDGKGESKPVADNQTAEGKAQNRRVEFIKQ